MRQLRWLAAFVSLIFVLQLTGFSQETAPDTNRVKEHYTKYEYRIPMRDGVRLFTIVYVPKDTSQPYPFLLTRTPIARSKRIIPVR